MADASRVAREYGGVLGHRASSEGWRAVLGAQSIVLRDGAGGEPVIELAGEPGTAPLDVSDSGVRWRRVSASALAPAQSAGGTLARTATLRGCPTDATSPSGPRPAGRRLPAFLVRPDGDPAEPRPAVLVVHEMMGLNDDIRRIATVFADHGYVALAPDLLGAGWKPLCIARFFQGLGKAGTGRPYREMAAFQDWLAKEPYVDADRIGMAGFCAGGGFAMLYAARGGRNLRAIAPFYGAMPADESIIPDVCPTVASYGGRDASFGANGPLLEAALDAAGVPNDVKTYPDAGHSFMNEHSGVMGAIGPLMPMHVDDGTSQGDEKSFTTATTAPAVTTDDATLITANSARLNGDLTSLGTASSVTVSVEWGVTLGGPYPNETTGQAMTRTGTFYSDLGSLSPSTTYYYRAKAVGHGTSYGEEKSFSTLPPSPSVSTVDPSNITTNSARLNGDLTWLGTAGSVTVSFRWGTSPGSYSNETTGQDMTGAGTFYFDLSSLSPGTTYYYRAKAVGNGTSQGDEKSFSTATTAPAVTTDDATLITANSARLNGDLTSLGTAGSVTVSVEWGVTLGGPYPDETTGHAMTRTGTFYSDLGSLSPSTTYYYRAKAVGHGTSYGEEKSFSTLPPSPSVSTVDPSNTTTNSARLNGDLTWLGTAGSVRVSFRWGTSSGVIFIRDHRRRYDRHGNLLL